MNNYWKMNRIGFVNFWLYDEEIFEFVDGKLLLRGQNGSENPLRRRALFRLFWMVTEHPAGWIPLDQVTGGWSIIFSGKTEKMIQQVIFFLNFRKWKRMNIGRLQSVRGHGAENRWIFGDL